MLRRFALSLLAPILLFLLLVVPITVWGVSVEGVPKAKTVPLDIPPPTGLSGAAGFVEETASKAGFTTAETSPAAVAGALVNTFLSLIGIVFIILIIYAGFKWMTAGGNEEQVKKAKSTIVNSVIGIVVVMGAWFIYKFVGSIFGL